MFEKLDLGEKLGMFKRKSETILVKLFIIQKIQANP